MATEKAQQVIAQIQADKDSGVVSPLWKYLLGNKDVLAGDTPGAGDIQSYQDVAAEYRNIYPELSESDIEEQYNTPEYQTARDQAQAIGQAEGRAQGPSAEQAYRMQEVANQAINAGGINPYSAQEMTQSAYDQLVAEKNSALGSFVNTGSWTPEKEQQLQDAMAQKNYYTNTNVASGKGGDVGYTGAGGVVGAQAMGAAMDAANNGAQQIGAAADAAALGAQAGYGAGETARQLARELAQSTPSLPSEAQTKAMTEASPAMQGLESSESLPMGSLTPEKPSVGASLLDLAKIIPGVSNVIDTVDKGKAAWNAGSNLASKLSDTLSTPTDSTTTPTTPSIPSAGVGAMGSPFGVTSSPITGSTPPSKPSSGSMLSAFAEAPKFSPRGTIDYTGQRNLETSIKNAISPNKNIEYGFRQAQKPNKPKSSFLSAFK